MPDEPTQTAQEITPAPAPVEAPAPSAETAQQPPQPPAPQYVTKDEIKNLLAEIETKARETGRREMQAEKDREVAASIRRQRQLEADNAALQESLTNLDPDAKKDVELTRYRNREAQQAQMSAEDAQQAQVNATINAFYSNLTEHIKEEGIDPGDKRLDWGQAGESLTVRQNKVLKSLRAVKKELAKTEAQKTQDKIILERKAAGLESVDTTPNSAPATTRADFMSKFANGIIPMTKANVDRYNKYQQEE